MDSRLTDRKVSRYMDSRLTDLKVSRYNVHGQ
jgi:hypothetical protein